MKKSLVVFLLALGVVALVGVPAEAAEARICVGEPPLICVD